MCACACSVNVPCTDVGDEVLNGGVASGDEVLLDDAVECEQGAVGGVGGDDGSGDRSQKQKQEAAELGR